MDNTKNKQNNTGAKKLDEDKLRKRLQKLFKNKQPFGLVVQKKQQEKLVEHTKHTMPTKVDKDKGTGVAKKTEDSIQTTNKKNKNKNRIPKPVSEPVKAKPKLVNGTTIKTGMHLENGFQNETKEAPKRKKKQPKLTTMSGSLPNGNANKKLPEGERNKATKDAAKSKKSKKKNLANGFMQQKVTVQNLANATTNKKGSTVEESKGITKSKKPKEALVNGSDDGKFVKTKKSKNNKKSKIHSQQPLDKDAAITTTNKSSNTPNKASIKQKKIQHSKEAASADTKKKASKRKALNSQHAPQKKHKKTKQQTQVTHTADNDSDGSETASDYSFSIDENDPTTWPGWDNDCMEINANNFEDGEDIGDIDDENEDSESEDFADYFSDENDYDSNSEHYSDFDEDDYEEEDDEDDSYDYESDDNDDDCFGSDDEDYRLPENVPEDLIIHQGTAEKRNLEPSDEVQFDSDAEEAQLIELQHQTFIKSIEQPMQYALAELEKLNLKLYKIAPKLIKAAFDDDDDELTNNAAKCPQLVPIIDEDGFQLYSEHMDLDSDSDASFESNYEECSEQESSMDEGDVNSKYLKRPEDDESSDDEEDDDDDEDDVERDAEGNIVSAPVLRKRAAMSAHIVDALNADFSAPTHLRETLERAPSPVDLLPSEVLAKYQKKQLKGKVLTTQVMKPMLEKKLPVQQKAKKTTAAVLKDTTVQLKTGSPTVAVSGDESKVSLDDSVDSSQNTGQDVSENSARNVAEDVSENISQNVTPDVSQVDSADVSQECSADVSQEFSPDVSQEVSPDVSQEVSQDVSQEVSQNVSQDSPQDISQNIAMRSIFCNAIDSNHVLVLLRDPIFIYGTVRLILLAGNVQVYGYEPPIGEELEIFSPRGLSAVQITVKANTQTNRTQLEEAFEWLACYFAKNELQSLLSSFVLNSDALILLKRNEASPRKKLLANYHKYMSENLFPNMNGLPTDRPHYASEYMLRCFLNAHSDRPLRLDAAQWQQLQLQPHSKMLLAGGKSVGKSTLLRYLLNRHLKQQPKVLLIDLDIGQPELFVPQTISAAVVSQPLLGPGCFLNLQPAKAYVIGHSNIVLCPQRYMRAVQQLLRECRQHAEYAQFPWLVNTMGYNKGFGAELLAVICEILQPTDVVQLQSNKPINNFDYLLEAHVLASLPRSIFTDIEFQRDEESMLLPSTAHCLHVINSAVLQQSRYQREWDMSAKDMRYANVLARLSATLTGANDWLSDCQPLCASLDHLQVISLQPGQYTREQLLKAIEANMVYLCIRDAYATDETPISCVGLGVVRGIDYHVNQIYLVPAMPAALMTSVNCLAIGEMPLPTSMLSNQGPKVQDTAPYLYNTVAANASKSIKQIYHRPPEFLHGNHKQLI